ncbi:hypothetical protein G5I_08761 [Acromyrmex echinatior]|uniref:Uncharacterized protein n=1 Tax=Acromyrmex echinatior TaxID=103372 RepID=F4WSD3_ACREC|nr:hypothetical protein G5I_08761 [Acromyrmex echinatior]
MAKSTLLLSLIGVESSFRKNGGDTKYETLHFGGTNYNLLSVGVSTDSDSKSTLEENPHTSIRAVATETSLPKSSVHKMIIGSVGKIVITVTSDTLYIQVVKVKLFHVERYVTPPNRMEDAQVYFMMSMIYLFRPPLTVKAIYRKTAEAKLYT